MIHIVKEHHIVNVWSNETIQNTMRNAFPEKRIFIWGGNTV